jgi:hypothetical protein
VIIFRKPIPGFRHALVSEQRAGNFATLEMLAGGFRLIFV